ncbi:MAG TPA: hypothetical protein VNT26_13745 [Candidatus Sulfotelmatobacter sp.]|nr:hypothetical protein [Candidatus Sulfotelmatobacter sp.]
MPISLFIGVGVALWLASCVAALLAIRWSRVPGRRRFPAALASSCLALALGYLGWSHYHFAASKTVNGHVQWSVNSKWFFLAALLLGAGSLAWALWSARKTATLPPPPTA